MTQRILIMGLPGAGKTYLAQHINDHLQNEKKRVGWLNADDVRKKYNDWDFSEEGRIRQSHRMRELADLMVECDYVICDFVAPLVEMRNNFKADWTVWVDTIDQVVTKIPTGYLFLRKCMTSASPNSTEKSGASLLPHTY
jgi:adenylylsulfate kinase